MTAKYRTESVRFDDVPGHLPKANVPEHIDLEKLSGEIVARLPGLNDSDLVKDAVWRDLLSFTEHFRSFSSAKTILRVYKQLSSKKHPGSFKPLSAYNGITKLSDTASWVDIGFTFATSSPILAENAGIVSLIPSTTHPSGWQIWMLRIAFRLPAGTSARCLIIGTANTAHDIATSLLPVASSVTMLQRSPTFVFPAEWLHAAQDAHYNLSTPVPHADRLAVTYPNKIMREMTNSAVHALIDAHPERFDALERAGFLLERKGDIYDNLYRRLGGHYVDIGTSAQIARGEIKVVAKRVATWTEKGVRFEDGTEEEADVVVFATGFEHDFWTTAGGLVGEETADGVDDYFGIDGEGEVRGAFRWAGHRGLYYTGGDIRQCRFLTRFVALQIQAGVLGRPMEPYLGNGE
ncbi:hypothetical protein KVT40_005269 [Elsinoe batatas]|uniref:Uncharacterized protein n=1 Tax=Elsinoe batatas TaxID=2601811 RepID=A0A8K0PI66_9PEZI|nr:hypothetical protein KVT40_005269 [Elsinoe batatas]